MNGSPEPLFRGSPSIDVFADAKARLTIPLVWHQLELPGQPGKSCRSPFREDHNASFSVYDQGRRWKDHATGEGGDLVDFLKTALRGDWSTVRLWLKGQSRLRRHSADKTSLTKNITGGIKWPGVFRKASSQVIANFARSRGYRAEAVENASNAGILRFLTIGNMECYAVTDSEQRAGEIRRMDRRFFKYGGKAYPLSGVDKSWLVGASALRTAPLGTRVLLVEGATDLLMALHLLSVFQTSIGKSQPPWIPVALLGASCKRIAPGCADLLRGRRVRLTPDGDEAGDGMLRHWKPLLERVGCEVDSIALERGRDLSDMVGTLNPQILFA